MTETFDSEWFYGSVVLERCFVMEDMTVSRRVVMAIVTVGKVIIKHGQAGNDQVIVEVSAPSIIGSLVSDSEAYYRIVVGRFDVANRVCVGNLVAVSRCSCG